MMNIFGFLIKGISPFHLRLPALLLLALLLLCCGACTKNEFTVSADMGNKGVTESLTLVYYALDKIGGRVISQTVPVVEGKLEARCVTVLPTVVYLYSGARLQLIFYAEKGDKITIDTRKTPWTAGGNDINEQCAKWLTANATAVNNGSQRDVNKAVAAQVREHPSDKLSLLLLLTQYTGSINPNEFASLWQTLDPDLRDDDKLLRAIGKNGDTMALEPASPKKIAKVRLHARGDSLLSVKTADADTTLFFFWGLPTRRMEEGKRLRRRLEQRHSGVRVIDINMEADTIGWAYILENDSTRNWHHAWAPGAEQNSALQQFEITGDPFYVMTDRQGRQIYRGATNPIDKIK